MYDLMDFAEPKYNKQEEYQKDDKLIEAAQEDPAAFEAIYQLYLPRVYRYVSVRLSNIDDAADLTQHIFLQVFKSLPGYRARGVPFAAWLFRIASNKVNDVYRRHRETISYESLTEPQHPVSENDPIEIAIRNERLTRLSEILAQLKPDKQELLALRFAANLNSQQIADIVGKSPAAVKKQLSRTLQALKEQYNDEG